MKLTDVIKIYEELQKTTAWGGEIQFCDLEHAIENVCGIENDVPDCQPDTPPGQIIAALQ